MSTTYSLAVFILPLVGWKANGVFWKPTMTKTTADGFKFHTVLLSPFYECHGFAKSRNQTIDSSIALLLRASSPATIRWFVITVWVGVAIKRIVFGWLPHICKKVLKRKP